MVNPLSVSVQSSGKKRLILDLRHVNFFVNKSKIKFEDAQSMLIYGLILSILSLGIMMLKFTPHTKDFSVLRGFSMGFENILSLSFALWSFYGPLYFHQSYASPRQALA